MTSIHSTLRRPVSAYIMPPAIAAMLPSNAIVADAFAYARQHPNSPLATWCTETIIPCAAEQTSAISWGAAIPAIPTDLIAQWATPKNIAIAHIEAWRDAENILPAEQRQRTAASARMMTQLDDTGHVHGDLNLADSTVLTALPEGLQVNGNLYLNRCTALTTLPAGLLVNGSMYLGDCTALTTLPAGLRVNGNMFLDDCTALTTLPAGLHVGGDLNLSYCTALTALPAWLTELRHRSDGRARHINLGGIRLPDAVLEALQTINEQNVGVDFILEEADPEDSARSQMTLRINRSGNIFDQAFDAYKDKLPADFQRPPYVIFNGEMGIDEGGVGKDFINTVLRSFFENGHLFVARTDNPSQFQPNTKIHTLTDDMRAQLRVAGGFVAMTVLAQLPCPLLLSDGVFACTTSLKEDLSQAPNEVLLALLATFAPSFSHVLSGLVGDSVEAADLVFAITRSDGTTINLKDNGDEMPVTKENVHEYIRLYTLHTLQSYVNHLTPFWGGVADVLGQERYQALIQAPNVSEILCGKTTIDVADWQAHTEFKDLPASVTPDQADQAKATFFAAVKQLTAQEQSKLLEFATGYTRPPNGGFQALQARNAPRKFSLSVGANPARIPVAHTCFNRLDIPRNMRDDEINEALLKAGAEPPHWLTPSTHNERRIALMLARLRVCLSGDGRFDLV